MILHHEAAWQSKKNLFTKSYIVHRHGLICPWAVWTGTLNGGLLEFQGDCSIPETL